MGIVKCLYEIKKKKASIIRYQGGLGNQMFQYAYKLRLKSMGFKVYDDLSFYYFNQQYMPFVLTEVFNNIQIDECSSNMLVTKAVRGIVKKKDIYKLDENYTLYNEYNLTTAGWHEGYWQSYKYYESIMQEINHVFQFEKTKNSYVANLAKEIQCLNAISIHVRAGDYLKKENYKNFGGICTKEYYNNAIEYMSIHLSNPVFFVFSDDVDWVKKNIPIKNVIYMDNKKTNDYEDWMDMYFMSICKHNIIANSSFSWWGAWLNRNSDKIVICPKKWTQEYDNIEICPRDWIRL